MLIIPFIILQTLALIFFFWAYNTDRAEVPILAMFLLFATAITSSNIQYLNCYTNQTITNYAYNTLNLTEQTITTNTNACETIKTTSTPLMLSNIGLAMLMLILTYQNLIAFKKI